MVTVTIPIAKLRNPLNGSREHWAVKSKRAKSQRAATLLVLKAADAKGALACDASLALLTAPVAPGRARLAVHLVRVFAGNSKPMDDDGLSASLKHVRDAVAEYFGIDDGDPRIWFTYAQERGPACVRVELSVEAVPAEAPRITVGIVDGEVRRFRAPDAYGDSPRDVGYEGDA